MTNQGDLIKKYAEAKKVQSEIEEWSRRNFKDQPASYPLHGVVEEYGEYIEAGHPDDVFDALADMGIYLCDFAARCNVSIDAAAAFAELTNGQIRVDITQNEVVCTIARVNRAFLKMKQKIRQSEEHEEQLIKQIGILWMTLNVLAHRSCDKSIYDLVRSTWDQVVSKRDWTKENKGEVDA